MNTQPIYDESKIDTMSKEDLINYKDDIINKINTTVLTQPERQKLINIGNKIEEQLAAIEREPKVRANAIFTEKGSFGPNTELLNTPTLNNFVVPTKEGIQSVFLNKLKEEHKTKTVVKNYFERCENGYYIENYGLNEYALSPKIINDYVSKLTELYRNPTSTKEDFYTLFQTPTGIDGITAKNNPFIMNTYDEFSKSVLLRGPDSILRIDSKARAKQQIVRLYKAETRKEIFRLLVDDNGSPLFPHNNPEDPCYYLGTSGDFNLGLIETADSACKFLIKNKEKIIQINQSKPLFKGASKVVLSLTNAVAGGISSSLKSLLEDINSTCSSLITTDLDKTNPNTQVQKSMISWLMKKSKRTVNKIATFIPRALFGNIFRISSYVFKTLHDRELNAVVTRLLQKPNSSIEAKELAIKNSFLNLNSNYRTKKFTEFCYYNILCGFATVSPFSLLYFLRNSGSALMNFFKDFFKLITLDNFTSDESRLVNTILYKTKSGGGDDYYEEEDLTISGGATPTTTGQATAYVVCYLCMFIVALMIESTGNKR